MDPIGTDALAGLRVFEVAEILELTGEEIETVDIPNVGILDPHLVVSRRAGKSEMTELPAVRLPLLRCLPDLKLLSLFVEFRDCALVHHADPRIPVLVEFKIESAHRRSRLNDRNGILRHLSGLRIHLAKEHLAEVRIPDVSFRVEDDI